MIILGRVEFKSSVFLNKLNLCLIKLDPLPSLKVIINHETCIGFSSFEA